MPPPAAAVIVNALADVLQAAGVRPRGARELAAARKKAHQPVTRTLIRGIRLGTRRARARSVSVKDGWMVARAVEGVVAVIRAPPGQPRPRKAGPPQAPAMNDACNV